MRSHTFARFVARSIAILFACALLATACGSDEAPVTSEDLFAPSDDALDVATKPPVADQYLVPVSALEVTDLIEGDGEEAATGDQVSLQYVGVLADGGSQFDASWDRGAQPFTFTLGSGQVISGWDDGIVGMKVGGRRVLQIPSAQAYGETARGADIPANSDLVFIVDLVEIAPPPPPTPTPIPAPPVPEDALGSFDELGIMDLAEGSGPAIKAGDIVDVQYVGVDAETGTEFDSSWTRGADPFRVIAGAPGVIEGWQTGVIGAQVGTERILQIPSAQAYGEGDLVFRIHIESIEPGPPAHLLTFEGDAPSKVETSTLIEGEGNGADTGDVVNSRVVVLRYSDSTILTTTYADESVTPLFISEDGLLPGLNEGIVGIKAGETRQIVVPGRVAFPEGLPQNAGITDENDALVFVVEAIDVSELDEG